MGCADKGEIAVLERIVALLLSLALLAERLGARPGLRALEALWALTRAERVARDFLCGTALEADLVAQDMFVRTEIDTANAASRLAHKFRVLALWLHHVIGMLSIASSGGTVSRPNPPAPPRTERRIARVRRPAVIDTS